MSKRIQSFFSVDTAAKRPKYDADSLPTSHHATYPFPIRNLPSHIAKPLSNLASQTPPKKIDNRPHLDLLYFQPLIPSPLARDLFCFLRNELPFYRVQYAIRRGPTESQITTPRFTTVFGVDETAYFVPDPGVSPGDAVSMLLVDRKSDKPVPSDKYQYAPRPLPACLEVLRQCVEAATADGTTYNFCLVNYYASGDDSISYHSDDERFLGPQPTIASLSLGASRDFLLKHKPVAGEAKEKVDTTPLKFNLAAGDLVVMRGETQANWLHSIPKRKGSHAPQGRINITFRKAVVPGGTNNYYNYNVGKGPVYRWNQDRGEMVKVGTD
ncbi:DNA repair family protein [Aspergillus terreus]|uniref:DNA repair family protein n=1 Tax=Aspergillus terreus TaxID=33178 RepID=A0A5M3Z6B6_ASPTE|nr:hypothetical protein ATETN484_0009048300 [Aspergillus terreus]GFF17934.1 DNA repair family protein [Aspergillus terreus]